MSDPLPQTSILLDKPANAASLLRSYATPLATVLMLVVGVSGGALFFHLANGPMKEMHEWLGMGLLLAVGLHLLRNWKAFRHVLGQPRAQWLMGAGILATAAFLVLLPVGGKGGNPAFALMRSAEHASLSSLAPVLGTTPEKLIARLDAEGIEASPEQRIDAIAQVMHIPSREVLEMLIQDQRP